MPRRQTGIEVRAVAADEFDRFRRTVMEGFGAERDPDESGERLSAILKLERTYVAFDGSEIVGTSGTYERQLSVPGAEVAMAGLTLVTVRPTHRRQGILRKMMSRHFADAAEHGEALSGLWASEPVIYPRFGYGIATECYHTEVNASEVEFLPGPAPDTMRFIELGGAEATLAPLYDRGRRAGCLGRTLPWWRNRSLYDSPEGRSGATSLRIAVATRSGQSVGYVSFRQRPQNDGGVFNGRIEIVEMIACDPQAERSLWHFVTHIDLFPHVVYWNTPTDSLLPWLVANRRAVRMSRGDGLWLRLLDVPGALESRQYHGNAAFHFEVRGPGESAAQRFRFEVEADGVSCIASESEPDLWLTSEGLASLYLGNIGSRTLVASGRAGGSEAVLRQLGDLFAGDRPPWCPEVF